LGKKGVAVGVIAFLLGLVLLVDDLHDFVPGTDFLHFLPDFDPYIIAGFQFHHLYLGIIIMVIGLYIAARYDN
jgi:hypothetical protein